MLHMLPLVLHLVRNLRWVFVIFVNRGGGEILSVNLVAGRWTKASSTDVSAYFPLARAVGF
jgi:hypothetical protein